MRMWVQPYKNQRTSNVQSLIPLAPGLTDAMAGPHAVRVSKLGAVDHFLHLLSDLACSSTATHRQHQAETVLLHPAGSVTPPLGTQPGCLG
jgi:hypothetical protein